MKIYLASGFNRRSELRELANKLESIGHLVVSEWIWLDRRAERGSDNWDDFAKEIARSNVKDLKRCEAVVIDAYGIRDSNHGGVHTELGWGLAKNLDIYLIGPRGNTFHWLENIKRVEDYEELLRLI